MGGNSLHLAAVQQERGYGDVRWGTYRQIQARGGQVRKGERGTRILSFQDKKRIAVTDERGLTTGEASHATLEDQRGIAAAQAERAEEPRREPAATPRIAAASRCITRKYISHIDFDPRYAPRL